MSEQLKYDLSKVPVADIQKMLDALNGSSGDAKRQVAESLMKSLTEVNAIGTNVVESQDNALRGYTGATDAIRQSTEKDIPIRQQIDELRIKNDLALREGRTKAALEALDPLLTRAEDRTERRDAQQRAMLGDITGHQDKQNSRADLTTRLGLLRDLGLGAMLMFGN
tara:strand:- start:2466 stop:2966 length:501 start_codon:yes stop_codon:yes gene_type:complete